jgi:hypothetical protein
MTRMLFVLVLAVLVGCAGGQMTVRSYATARPSQEPEATVTVEYHVKF